MRKINQDKDLDERADELRMAMFDVERPLETTTLDGLNGMVPADARQRFVLRPLLISITPTVNWHRLYPTCPQRVSR